MVTYAELMSCDPEEVRRWGAAWTNLWVKRVDHRVAAIEKSASKLDDSWDGEAYRSAARLLKGYASTIADSEKSFRMVDTVLSGLADDLRTAKGMLADVNDAAARIPATISPDGETITYTGEEFNPKRREAIKGRIEELFDDIDAALAKANRADRAAADELKKLHPGYDPTNPSKGYVPPGEIPKKGTDPKKVKAWWDSLTPQEQQYLIHTHPERIGWLDGVPATARDQANRVRLADEHEKAERRKKQLEDRKADLEAELRKAGEPAPGKSSLRIKTALSRVETELELVKNNLKGMETIETRLYDQPDKPRAYLLGFEPGTLDDVDGNGKPDDDGRAIIAVGNPDTADHVATYVPGTGADLAHIKKDIVRTDAMSTEAKKLAPHDDTSVILWLGYDAPDSVPDAAMESYAEDATKDLRRFQNGLRVTHEGQPSHNTVIGHSYGSTVVGHTAAGDGGIAADELVFVGSPGVGVDDAGELGVPPDHVWGTTAEHDAIKYTLEWHGVSPASERFGGRVFESDPGDPDDEQGTHSAYWKKYSMSRLNMGFIITGQPHEVTRPAPEPPPDPTDFYRGPGVIPLVPPFGG